jgi:hypothetical protein
MAGFFASLGFEFVARRKRLRKALGDGRASLFEYVILLGMVLGVAAPGFGPKGFVGALYGPLLPALLIAGYLLLDAGRQRVVARGGDESLSPAFDRRALWFCVAVAAIGYATFVWALLAPAPFELVPTEEPASALSVTIGP